MEKKKVNRDCDLCGSSEKRLITTENGYPISKCSSCGFVYVNEIPEVENGKVLGEYYSEDKEDIEEIRERYKDVSTFLLDEIEKHSSGGKVLDVGCGYGFFLLNAMEKGWDAFGTDLSEKAIEYAKKEQNLQNVVCSDLYEDIFPGQKFDSVNLTNVLEHVPSPTKTLNDCGRLLDENGVLTVRVPNMEFNDVKRKLSSVLRLFKLASEAHLTYLSTAPPTHLSGFSSRTLRKYFDKAGLETIEIKPSKLSTAAEESIVYQGFEFFVQVLYKLSFRTINLSPTILAIAKKRHGPHGQPAGR